jgi:protein-disulfide isomerase
VSPDTVYDVPVGSSPVRGRADALVTIAMFTDFQCPFCVRVMPTITTLLERHPEARLVFKHFPLPMHPDARPAAIAAIAADRAGRFWPFHDLVWAAGGKDLGGRAGMRRFAAMSAVDLTRFERDMDDPRTTETLEADLALARRVGVTGTPCFFINGKKLSGARPLEDFETAVAAARALAEDLVKSGVPRTAVYDVVRKTATVH